jgi:hypothetical protein
MKTKIFCVGLNKTGTSSLHVAFEMLGLKSVHWKDDNGLNIKTKIGENFLNGINILDGIERYDAFSDWDMGTSHQVFKEFDKQYPNSKFILNTRDIGGWLDSREKHVKRNQQKKSENPDADITWLTVDREAWKLQYERHHEEVYNHFKERKSELLTFDVTKGDGWEILCPFLDLPIPQSPFPKANVASQKGTLRRKIKMVISRFLGRVTAGKKRRPKSDSY